MEADPDKISAMMKYPKPGNITELRSFMGIVNQLGDFTKEISSAAQPLRELLSEKNKYQRLPCHDQAFDAVKGDKISILYQCYLPLIMTLSTTH